MKKIFLILACTLALFTTGCVKYSYNIEIDNKDNVSVSETEAINAKLIKSFSPNADVEMKKKLEEKKPELEKDGYTVESYDDGTFIGLKRTKNYEISSYDSSNLPKGFLATGKAPIEKDKKFFKTTYKISLNYDIKSASKEQGMNNFSGMPQQNSFSTSDSSFTDDNINSTERIVSQEKNVNPTTGETVEKITYENGMSTTTTYNAQEMQNFGNTVGSMMNANPAMAPSADLTIKLPVKAKEHNAKEETKNNEYKWDLISEAPVDIQITYEKTNVANIIILVAIVSIGLLCFVAYGNGNKNV